MTIEHQVLGSPGRDNALFLRIDSGQSISRLLFDCGDGCLAGLSFSEVQSIDHLCFSHLHMDHVGGFDSFFRCTFNRDSRSNQIWGPPGSAAILQHRFRGFWWNLTAGQAATWRVHEVHESAVETFRFEIAEAFAECHSEGSRPWQEVVVTEDSFAIEALRLQHHGPCLGYLVTEPAKRNLDVTRLAGLGLKPGPWVGQLKSASAPPTLEIGGRSFDLDHLRAELLTETAGESIAYLTDFLLDPETHDRLVSRLKGCDTVICDAQYRHSDVELAQRNAHTTTTQVAHMARQAEVGRLVLFHLSDRYRPEEWLEMLDECRAIFPATSLPEDWSLSA